MIKALDESRDVKTNIFRLGEFKIIESDARYLRWEAHFGLGEIKEGRCFKKNSILFIGPPESRHDGFLKFEFMAHLKGFPDWLKTKYYCNGLEVYHCQTGKKVTKEEMMLWKPNRGINGTSGKFAERSEPLLNAIFTKRTQNNAAFRLQRYEIAQKPNGQIVWRTHAGPNTFSSGTCIILEDIVFMGSRQNERTHLNKRQFLANLEKLPEWHQTAYYCSKLSLHECKTENEMQPKRKRWPGERKATVKHAGQKGYKRGTLFELKAPDLSIKWEAFWSQLTKKRLSHAVGWIFSTLPIFFAYLIRLWKKFRGRWHYKKGKRSSIHRRDD